MTEGTDSDEATITRFEFDGYGYMIQVPNGRWVSYADAVEAVEDALRLRRLETMAKELSPVHFFWNPDGNWEVSLGDSAGGVTKVRWPGTFYEAIDLAIAAYKEGKMTDRAESAVGSSTTLRDSFAQDIGRFVAEPKDSGQ